MLTYETAEELLKAWPSAKRIKLPIPELKMWIGYHPQVIGATGLVRKFRFAVPREGWEGWLERLERFEADLEAFGYKMTTEVAWRVWVRDNGASGRPSSSEQTDANSDSRMRCERCPFNVANI